MKKWKVVYTRQAELDLINIYDYITSSLLAPENAKKQVRRIVEKIAKLNLMPLRCELYEKEPWHSKGLRVLAVDNFSVFYLPVEKQKNVVVVRIMFSKRNIDEQLK